MLLADMAQSTQTIAAAVEAHRSDRQRPVVWRTSNFRVISTASMQRLWRRHPVVSVGLLKAAFPR
jgi:hypothetical protein